MEQVGDGDTNHNWGAWNGPQRLRNGAGIDGNRISNRNNSNYSIVEIGQNTGKIPEELKRLAVT